MKQAVKSAISEEDRNKNVMVFGLCEEEAEQLETKIGELFQELDEKPRVTATRIGKTPVSGRSRPVKIVCHTSNTANQILKKSGKLKQVQRFKNVYLRPDMLPEEREDRKRLVAELKKAILDQPSLYHYIQGGKVMSKEKVGT